MITLKQMYIEYIQTQQRRLEELEKQLVKTKEDIDSVTKLMLECPYEKEHEIPQDD